MQEQTMPIHDWTRVDADLFHDFRQTWTINIRNALNGGLLPKGYSALVERSVDEVPGALATTNNRITIRRPLSRVVSVIEIVSPGNKGTRSALRSFVRGIAHLLGHGVNVLVIDLFPPGLNDPQGIHKAIWDQSEDLPFELPPGKPLAVVAYASTTTTEAYVEPLGFTDHLPDMPLFLDSDSYVPVPLEATYRATWASCPEDTREAVERGEPLPDEP
jgi:hypothetical protein